jgi:(1->4)-alpha-D-glucan 1-alpha-D-glucosylmutase
VAKRAEGEPQYVPCSTYRLQLNRLLTFRQAASLLDYLQDLGISDCYASPFLMARTGSMHGYDVTDPTRLNPQIGDEQDFHEFTEELKRRGMGLIADVVPNHMCVTDPSNTWWWDVLENGPSSPYSRFFDIDWTPPKAELANKVLLPFLADQFGVTLENRQLAVAYESGGFFIDCQGVRFPVAPVTWPTILDGVLRQVHDQLGASHDEVLELESILTSISHLPSREDTDTKKVHERRREKEIAKRRLARLAESSSTVRTALKESLAAINGRKGEPRSFDQLERLLADQAYRFSYWRVAADEINYRRFFDINELAAIRVEDPEVFAPVHALIFELVKKGQISGMRIDHPDGLFDPQQYFHDLQQQLPLVDAPDPSPERADAVRRFYLVAEKVLVGHEELRPSWAVEGTTGYGFLNLLNGLFVDSSRKHALLRLYEQFTGWSQSYDDLLYECKRLVLQVSMSSELTVLSRRLDRIAEQHRRSRDFTLASLGDALQEVIACFPVYRSYIGEKTVRPDAEDQLHIRQAIESAKRRNAAFSGSIFDFIQDVLLLKDPDSISEAERVERRLFVMRFQQLTGPVMAKGLEDTAFYRYAPLLSLNEVGGSPRPFGVSVSSFHSRNLDRQFLWSNSMLTTSTHDHKRSEDVRARINALSEIPTEWYRAIRSWQQLNADKKISVAGETVPSANEEYFLYQTLVGAWPMSPMNEQEHGEFVQRIHVHMEKALREAKIHTSWVSPNVAYETVFHKHLDAILARSPGNLFLDAFLPFQARIATVGVFNSLSQLLLKITSPGVPDFYQGTEVWNFTLTDPDNRRPVDYEPLRSLLKQLRGEEGGDLAALVERLIQSPDDGAIKLYLTRAALRLRCQERDLFAKGRYLPLRAIGEKHRHVVAFARSHGGRQVLVMAGRLFAQLGVDRRLPVGEETWGDTTVMLRRQFATNKYRDAFTGQTVIVGRHKNHQVLPLSEVFSRIPLALLVPEDGEEHAG